MSNQNSWFTTDNARNAQPHGQRGPSVSPPSTGLSSSTTRLGGRGGWRHAAVVATAACAALIPAGAASATPCEYHVGAAKAACKAHWHRAHQAYPKPDPTWREFLNRATPYEQRTLHAIARCEEPYAHGGPGWPDVAWGFQGGVYSTAFGMANSTVGIGVSITGYRWPTTNHAAEAFLALAVLRRYNAAAWGCGRGL